MTVRVLIACPGLGLAPRGFERFARDCWRALRDEPGLDVFLAKGRGHSGDRDHTVPTLSREHPLSRAVSGGIGRPAFWTEQMTFALAVQPLLLRVRPHVVLVSEWGSAGALARARRATRRSFRILLCNGAAGPPPFPPGADHVQHPVPSLLERALAAGEPTGRHTHLPLGVDVPRRWRGPPEDAERRSLRRKLGLPADRRLLLSVGALNATEKRMDLVIRELGKLQASRRPHLAMVGAREAETPWILELARATLGADGFTARTVPASETGDHYRAADAFVLASMSEGFGLTMVEASSHGLPVLAHDFDVSRFVLGEHGRLADLLVPGALAALVEGLGEDDAVAARGAARHRAAYERFSWDVLAPRYVELLRRCAGAAW